MLPFHLVGIPKPYARDSFAAMRSATMMVITLKKSN
jgi:hypothetical protein